jgi:hypothetical protein
MWAMPFEGYSRYADEGRRAKWPLKKRDIANEIGQRFRAGVGVRTFHMSSEEYQWQI